MATQGLDHHVSGALGCDGGGRMPWRMTIAARLCLGFFLVLLIIGGLGGGAIVATETLRGPAPLSP